MATVDTPPATRKFIGAAPACRKLEVTLRRLQELAEGGHISVQKLPGIPPRYCLADIDRLLEQSLRPAKVEPAPGEAQV
jgi:hypothetical protein